MTRTTRRRSSFGPAAERFRRCEAHSPSGALQRTAVAIARRAHAEAEIARTHLKQAIILAPSTVDAYALLGCTALTLASCWKRKSRRNASELAPGREDSPAGARRSRWVTVRLAARATLTMLKGDDETELARRSTAASVHSNENRRCAGAARRRGPPARRRPTAHRRFQWGLRPRKSSGCVDAGPGNAPASESQGDSRAPRPTPRVAGSRLEGFLTEMECANGITLHLRTDSGAVLFHTDTPSQLNFVSYSVNAPKELGCGAVTPEQHVVIVYRPGTDQRVRGDPISVEFAP